MADPRTAAFKAAEIEIRGYVISEDNDHALKDLALALHAVGDLIEAGGEMHEIPESDLGALFRTFARQVKAIHEAAPFANRAMARPRSIN